MHRVRWTAVALGVALAAVLIAGVNVALLAAGVGVLEPLAWIPLGVSGLALGLAALRGRAAPAGDHHIALLQGVIDGTSDAVFVKDVKGRYLLINEAGARILGKPPEAVIGEMDARIYSEQTSRQIQNSELTILLQGQPQTTEEVRTIGGVSRVYSVTRAPYRDARGTIIGIIGIARDITERKEAEELVRRQTEALSRALKLVADEPAIDPLVEHVVRAVARELKASSVSLFVLSDRDGRAEAVATDETARIVEKTREGDPLTGKPASIDDRDEIWRRLCERRTPIAVEDVAQSSLVGAELRMWASFHGLSTLLVVPLLWGHEVIGAVSIFSRDRRVFKPEEQEMAQALVHLATLALQLTRMAQEHQESALIEERNRMAREIHDTLAQGFTGIIFQLEAALEVLQEDPQGGTVHIERALEQARTSLADARRSVRELRPQALESGGLARALRELVEKSGGAAWPRLELSVRGAAFAFSPEVEGNLLKIAQEAVTNALKHAQARTVRVDLSYGEWETTLSVADDGRGFSPSGNGRPGGYGLSLMKERAQFLQGRFEVASQPGAGTRVSVSVGVPPPGA